MQRQHSLSHGRAQPQPCDECDFVLKRYIYHEFFQLVSTWLKPAQCVHDARVVLPRRQWPDPARKAQTITRRPSTG